MGCKEATTVAGVYRPRQPQQSPLYQCVVNHYDELEQGGVFQRNVERQVLARFIDCGDLQKGFARIHCDDCGHEYLLAFSCKTRYFCPSCHQKRMLAYGEWIEEEVLNPVPHRQYVFTLPKLLRPHYHQRRRLGELCRIVALLLSSGYQSMGGKGQAGFIQFVQTFGDLVNFHPHIHVLAADGVFAPNGVFRVLPPLPKAELMQAFRQAVVASLIADGAIADEFGRNMLGWRHSGFSVDTSVRVKANDAEGRKQLARYMIRNPFSLEKMAYQSRQGMVIYRSKMHATLHRNYQLMPGTEWLKLLLRHIPNKGEHLVRYCGWYSNRARGMRRISAGSQDDASDELENEEARVESEFHHRIKSSWARLINKIYEVDPLTCSHCGTEMRIIAVIEQAPVIERILRHIGAWNPQPPQRGPPDTDEWPKGAQLPLTYEPLPPIA